MKHFARIVIATLALAVPLAIGVAAQRADTPEALLRAAADTAAVDGDLKGAIEQYKTIAERFKANRPVVATALLRSAEAYQKLGDPRARTIYEQLTRDFADQTEAVGLARTRLGRGQPADSPRAMALRKMWSSDAPEIANARFDTHYAVSADGRYLTYVDNYNTALVLRDLTSGTDRRLTTGGYPGPSPWGIYHSVISKDGTQVAFNASTVNQTMCEIRVASLAGTGVPLSRRLFGADDVSFIAPMDWSPDGKWLAVSLQRRDRTAQIGLISVPDGALRVLKSVEWRGTTAMAFSPDGRDLAFDMPVTENGTERDVFVMATDGSREVAAAAHPRNDVVIGWTPDGTRLLFASDRSGAMGLWAQGFAERKPHGTPELVKPDIGNVSPLGITGSGALYLGVRVNSPDVELTSIDVTTGKQTAPSVKPIQRFTGSNEQPTWSPDGKSLGYVSVRGDSFVLAVRTTDTGNTREMTPSPGLTYIAGLSWAPDGGSFAARGQDLKGRVGVFRIDARSGDVVPIFFQSSRPNSEYPTVEGFFWSPDGRRMYYHGNLGSIYERDLTSGNERTLVSGTAAEDGRLGPICLSPDGRWIATRRLESSTKSQTVVLLPVDGGTPRELLRVSQPESVLGNGSMSWTPDGRGLLVKKGTTADPQLWLVPVSGESPRRIDVAVTEFSQVRLHPDGQRLAIGSRQVSNEVWALENFLPTLKTSR